MSECTYFNGNSSSRWRTGTQLLQSAFLGVALLGCAVTTAQERGEGSRSPGVAMAPTEATPLPEATFFAFDDVSIPFTDNLYLTLHEPEKHPSNPVVSLGKLGTPDEYRAWYYGSVLRHDGKFKMWYVAASKEGFMEGALFNFEGWRFAYAESEDGVHWEKPDLGLVEFRGDRHNNLILVPPEIRGYDVIVWHEPEEPDPSRRFKMMAQVPWKEPSDRTYPLAITFSRHLRGGGTYLPLFSEDGLRWRLGVEARFENHYLLAEDMVVGQGTHFEGTGIYKWKGLYYLTGQGTVRHPLEPYGRDLILYRSPDLIHWPETHSMGFVRQDQHQRPPRGNKSPRNNRQAHEGVSVWNRGNVLIGIYGIWNGADDWNDVKVHLGLVISNDGIHFREPVPDFLFVRTGDADEWDFGGLQQGQGFENVGDKTYYWYGQLSQSEVPTRTGRPWARLGGIGLVTLGRDRFGSLSVRVGPSAPDRRGVFVTSELQLSHSARLWINAEGLGPRSTLRVELLDYWEQPLPGYSGEKAAIVEKSGLKVPVSFGEQALISGISESVKIRVSFEGPERGAISFYAAYLVAE